MELSRPFTFETPGKIVFGADTARLIPEEVRKLGVTKALVVSDEGLKAAGLLGTVTAHFDKAGLAYEVFTDVEENPSVETVEKAVRAYQAAGCDGLVGIGGGSPMDVAKASGIIVNNGGSIKDYEGRDKFKNAPPPLTLVPTTCGTGAEATPYLVITDKARHYKLTVVSSSVIPRLAVIDPNLLLNLPPRLIAATGMDALTHAIESYTNLAAQPISDAMDITAIQLIGENLRQAVANANPESLAAMALASVMAGMGFSNTRVGVAHAMSHPLGGYAHVHHGVANAILLPHVMEYNLIGNPRKYADIAEALGEDVEGLPVMDAARMSVEAVCKLSADIGIPAKLSEVGVTEEFLENMVVDGMLSGNVLVNPRRTNAEQMLDLFKRAL